MWERYRFSSEFPMGKLLRWNDSPNASPQPLWGQDFGLLFYPSNFPSGYPSKILHLPSNENVVYLTLKTLHLYHKLPPYLSPWENMKKRLKVLNCEVTSQALEGGVDPDMDPSGSRKI